MKPPSERYATYLELFRRELPCKRWLRVASQRPAVSSTGASSSVACKPRRRIMGVWL